MASPLRYPTNGSWPAEMRASLAAAYVDEPSVGAFLRKVGTIYPEPSVAGGVQRKWSRARLDTAISRRNGTKVECKDLTDLI